MATGRRTTTARGAWWLINLRQLREADCAFRSRATLDYNCVGFAIGDLRWFDPSGVDGTTWPGDLPRDLSLATFGLLFDRFGFEVCPGPESETGYEKLAVFGDPDGDFCHVARLRPDAVWVSKLGGLEDIEHPLGPMNGAGYGTIRVYRRRSIGLRTVIDVPKRYRL